MIINKITTGFVVQKFDTETGLCIRQEFIAGDAVEYEDESGNPIDDDDDDDDDDEYSEAFDVTKLVYQPFDMVQPKQTISYPAELKPILCKLETDVLVKEGLYNLAEAYAHAEIVDEYPNGWGVKVLYGQYDDAQYTYICYIRKDNHEVVENEEQMYIYPEEDAREETQGQDRESYSDNQDRDNYITEVECTEQYWDCECKYDYIHPITTTHCSKCGCDRCNQPPSRVNEVLKQGFIIK
jgi:hypothetical protein